MVYQQYLPETDNHERRSSQNRRNSLAKHRGKQPYSNVFRGYYRLRRVRTRWSDILKPPAKAITFLCRAVKFGKTKVNVNFCGARPRV